VSYAAGQFLEYNFVFFFVILEKKCIGISDLETNNNVMLQDERSRWMRYNAYTVFDLHTSKARYELKVVLLHLWRVNVKTIGRFFNVFTR
jgi:hypothetical protein